MRSVSLYKLLNAICDSDNDHTARHLTELLSKGAKGAAKSYVFCGGKANF